MTCWPQLKNPGNKWRPRNSGKDPFFKKVWEDLQSFRGEYKIWQTYAFLPRPKPQASDLYVKFKRTLRILHAILRRQHAGDSAECLSFMEIQSSWRMKPRASQQVFRHHRAGFRRIGHVLMWANCVVIALIILQVVLRYGFGHGLVILEELQWHFYAVGIMFGISYAIMTDSHVGMDLFTNDCRRSGRRDGIFSERSFCCSRLLF